MKQRSSKRAKALQPSDAVKRAVWERDEHCCVWCGKPGLPEAHFIPRNKSGLGIEQNILTLCRECHEEYDRHGPNSLEMERYFRGYLISHYPGWDESALYYRKDGN